MHKLPEFSQNEQFFKMKNTKTRVDHVPVIEKFAISLEENRHTQKFNSSKDICHMNGLNDVCWNGSEKRED